VRHGRRCLATGLQYCRSQSWRLRVRWQGCCSRFGWVGEGGTMRDWSWKGLGMRPLVFPTLALGAGCALPALSRGHPPGFACLAALLAGAAFVLRAWPGAHLGLLASGLLTGSVLAAWAERATPLSTGLPVRLEGRLGSVEVDARGGRGVLEVA